MTPKDSSRRVEREARLRWIPLGKIRVSPLAQRELNQARVDRLVAAFDPELIDVPTVNERDGWQYVIDGNHRVTALKTWLGDGWEDQQLQCWSYVGLTEQEEAEKFLRLSDTLPIHAFDKFKVGITAGRQAEIDVDRTVRTQGLVVSKDGVPGAIRAVGTLMKVHGRSDPVTLGRALRIIRDAYGDAGLEAAVIDGIGYLCQRYDGQLDEDAAVKRLGGAHGGVNGLLGKAEILRKQTGNVKGQCVAAAAVDIINAGRGGPRLQSWWKQ